MNGADSLAPAERIELLLAAADVLPRAEAEIARNAAFTLRMAEAKQLEFKRQLGLEP
jgi:hypothetical protein